MWHQWNANTGDIIVMWSTLYANLGTSLQTCVLHACMHGTCDICKMGALKYSNGLVGMPADLTGKDAEAHVQAPSQGFQGFLVSLL